MHNRTTSAQASTYHLWLSFAFLLCLTACGTDSSPAAKAPATSSATTTLPTEPVSPARPSRPAPVSDLTPKGPSVAANFQPLSYLEDMLERQTGASLFRFSLESPTEMAAPRQLLFSGLLETRLDAIDFPAFQLYLFSNRKDTYEAGEPVATTELVLEEEAPNAFSFQFLTEQMLEPGLYYYWISGEGGQRYLTGKVIVDY